MRPSAAKKAINTAIKAHRPVMIHGSPGVGKSDLVRQIAKDNNFELIDLRLSQLDPVDVRGVPSVNKGLTQWNTPSFLPQKGSGILFLDEINSASQATQAAAYQLVLDRKLGDYTLPDDWHVFAAGNRAKDRAIVNTMSTALRNRLMHINYEVNVDDWCTWAIEHNIHEAVLGFIRFRPMLLNEFEERGSSKEERARQLALKDQQAFATPRTWEYTSDMLKVGIDAEIEYEMLCGIIGEGTTAEFMGYVKYYRDMPNLDQVLMDPTRAKVPEEPATLFAVTTGLAMRVTEDNFDRAMKYVTRLPVEFQTMGVKDMLHRTPVLANQKAFTAWCLDNEQVLF